MALADLIRTAVSGLFVTLDDLAPAHTYVSTDASQGVYDAATGTYTRNDTTFANIKMVLSRFRAEEIDASVNVTTDIKVLIAALDLATTPKTQDRIHLTDGRNFMIERVMGVPGDSIHILQVRLTE